MIFSIGGILLRGTATFDCVDVMDLPSDSDWWRIYDESFPPNEREPRQVILDSLRKDVGMAFRTRLDGRTAGIATTHLLSDPPAVFLVYLAIDRTLRGRGVGGRLLEFSLEK